MVVIGLEVLEEMVLQEVVVLVILVEIKREEQVF